jgi:hypothetical protein
LKDAANAGSLLSEEGVDGLNSNGHSNEPKRRGRPPGSKTKTAVALEA